MPKLPLNKIIYLLLISGFFAFWIIPVKADVDITPPSRISDLIIYNPTVTTMTLQWTSPGDDVLNGTASSYDLRYSTSEITNENFNSASEVLDEPIPLVSGTVQTKKITGLSLNTVYYFAIKAIDDAGNTSAISNIPTFQTYPNTFYGGYTSLGKMYDDMESLANTYPDIVELVDFGDSYAKQQGALVDDGGNPVVGYDLRALKITNKSTHGEKPVFILTSEMHAREITAAEIANRFINTLVTGYGTDADITWLIDNQEIWVIPILNPDGRWMVERAMYLPYANPSPWLWRKNVRDVSSILCAWPPVGNNTPGVDLNRNFDWAWQLGNANFCNQTYRGPSPNSEPETQAIEALFRQIFKDYKGPQVSDPADITTTGLSIDLHNPSGKILWPWGDTTTDAPNAAAFEMMGTKLAGKVGYATGQVFDNLYQIAGGLDDWLYGNMGIPSFLYELKGEFAPPYSYVEDTLAHEGHNENFIYAAKISRQPYSLILGPDTNGISFSSNTLSANATDVMDGNEAIAGAEYYIDTPPWNSGTPVAMTSSDGTFNSPSEGITASVPTSGLSDGRHTIYLRSKDVSNNWGPVSAIFMTMPDRTGPIISSILSTPANISAIISWTTNEPSSSQILFGPSTTLGTTTTEVDTSPRVTSHSITISSLIPCSQYSYQVKSKDTAGNMTLSSTSNFFTTGCTASASPSESIQEAVDVSIGDTITLGDLTLLAPANFTDTTTNITFQANKLSEDTFFSGTPIPSGTYRVNSDVFNLKAFSNSTTLISTFTEPLTITIPYHSDTSGINVSTMKIYRHEESGWYPLSSCSVNTILHTITCQTSNFSDFAIFGEAQSTPLVNNMPQSHGHPPLPEIQQTEINSPVKKFVQPPDILLKLAGPTLKLGSKGDEVEKLQQSLNQALKKNIVADGIFGKQTLLATKLFQKKMGLPTDGLVGPTTKNKVNIEILDNPKNNIY